METVFMNSGFKLLKLVSSRFVVDVASRNCFNGSLSIHECHPSVWFVRKRTRVSHAGLRCAGAVRVAFDMVTCFT